MKRNPRAGVTLLETMIALAVMAIIAVILSSGLGAGARMLISSGRITQRVDEALARRDLRNWLERALAAPFPGQVDGGLRGTSSELRFSFVSDDGSFWAGDPVVVTLGRGEDGVVSLAALGSADQTQKPSEKTQVLSEKSSQLEISYFGRLHPEDPIIWLDHWSPEAGLPDLIRIAIADDANLPPFTIRPGKVALQSEISLSSVLPPTLPSRP